LKRIFLVLLALLISLVGVTAWGLSTLSQQHALAAPGQASMPSESLADLKALMSRESLAQALHGSPLSLSIPERDLNAVIQDLAGRLLQGGARVELTSTSLVLQLSAPIERSPLKMLSPAGSWLNLTAVLSLKSEGPPTLQSVRLGDLTLPPRLVLWAIEQVLQAHDLLAPANLLLSALSQVTVIGERLQVTLRWTDDLQGQTLALVVPMEDWPLLQTYDRHVLDALARGVGGNRVSQPQYPLRAVLHSAFMLAHQRTMAHGLLPVTDVSTPMSRAARENRAALVAVALAANNLSLEQLLPSQAAAPKRPRLPVSLRLRGREDFAQHYTISALMALMLGGRAADAVGLYKEMLDAGMGNGGSGFSFNDLALNRAGIRLGQRARQDPMGLQQGLGTEDALISDDDFIPRVDGLPEFLSHSELVRRYGGLKDARFSRQMADIDERVAALPVLQEPGRATNRR
jgi:hypothetical protein